MRKTITWWIIWFTLWVVFTTILSLYCIDKKQKIINMWMENISNFLECMDWWVYYWAKDLPYTAGDIMIDCTYKLISDTSETYKGV